MDIKTFLIKHNRGNVVMDLIFQIYDLLSFVPWVFDKNASESRKNLRSLKNMYAGKRCFIIGNGPSLNKTDLHLLKNEYTFGLNRIHLFFKKLGIKTTFLVSVNNLVINQSFKSFNELKCRKFFKWHANDGISFNKDTIFIRTLVRQQFSRDLEKGVWEGATVTYVAMQLAYYMGFSQVILVGVDHNFKTKGKSHREVTSKGDDPNHFDPNYFGKGFKWNLPDLETSEYAYKLARQAFDNDNREILDATVDGKLNVFRKISLDSVFIRDEHNFRKPFFSIITCTYNSERFVRRNIESVIEQNLQDYEHIFIDGYSNDNTYKIIREYQKKYPNSVKIFRSKPKGVANAFNIGIRHSIGKYIIHLNSDDCFNNKTALKDTYSFLKQNSEPDWIYGMVKTVDENDKKIGQFPRLKAFQKSNVNLLKLIDFVPHQAVFINKQVFNKYGYFDEGVKYVTDYEYWLRISGKTRWLFIDKVISNYTARKDSVSLDRTHKDELKNDTLLFHKKYSSGIEHVVFSLLNYSCITDVYRILRYHL